MNITEVIDLLEYTINKRIEELNKLMKAFRSLLSKKRLKKSEHECILNMRIAMAEIVKDLRPAEEVFFENNPEWKEIFRELNALDCRQDIEYHQIKNLGSSPLPIIKYRNPTTSDLICDLSNARYEIGVFWINKTNASAWVLCSIRNGEAIWQDIIYACGDFSKPETDISQSSVSQVDNNHTKQ